MESDKIPACNVRSADPQCCMTCAFFQHEGTGISSCLRPRGPSFDTLEYEYLYTVCNMWRSHRKHPLRATIEPA